MNKQKGYSISEVAFKLKIARVTVRGILTGLGIQPMPGYSKAGRLALVISEDDFKKVAEAEKKANK